MRMIDMTILSIASSSIFIAVALMSFASVVIPESIFASVPQTIYIPILNITCGLKVTIGAWSVVRLFIIKRGII